MDLLPLIFIVVGVIVLVAVGYFLRRRRVTSSEEVPEIGTPIDYTSQPLVDEPTGWRDRFNNLSLAGKILLVVVPLLVIVGGIVIVLALGDGLSGPPPENVPPPPQYGITINRVALANPQQIAISAESNLPPDTEVTAELLANSEPFAWYNPDGATTRVANGGKIDIRLAKIANAPTASETVSYTVKLSAKVDSTTVESTEPLVIPATYKSSFFQQPVAAAPTATPTQEVAAPTAEATTEPTAEPTAAPEGPAPLTASVFNGGNVRSTPSVRGSEVRDQINAGEQVQLLQKTSSGQWYLIKNIRNNVGWVSVTLLTIDGAVAEKIPVQGSAEPLPTAASLGDAPAGATAAPTTAAEQPAPTGLTASVFNGGNVRDRPVIAGSQVLDQINAGEQVELLQKTSSGQWYQIRNIRGKVGWVNVTLLTIDQSVAGRVPVAP